MEQLSVDEVIVLRAAVLWAQEAARDPNDAGPHGPQWEPGHLQAFEQAGFPSPPPTYYTRWDTIRLERESVAEVVRRANLTAGWVRARHGLPLSHQWLPGDALVGLWADLDAIDPLPIATLAWAHGRWSPLPDQHYGDVCTLLDDADAVRARRRPKLIPVDRDDPGAVNDALADLFVRTRCHVGASKACSPKALVDRYAQWAAQRWVACPRHPVVLEALLRAAGAHVEPHARDGRRSVVGVTPESDDHVEPREVARQRTLQDLAERLFRSAPPKLGAWLGKQGLDAAD